MTGGGKALYENTLRRLGPPQVSLLFPLHGMKQSARETGWLGICIVESQSGWRETFLEGDFPRRGLNEIEKRTAFLFEKGGWSFRRIGNVLLRSRNSPLHSTRFKDQLIPRKRVNVKAGLTTKFESRVDVTYVLTKMNARFNGHRVLNKGRRC